MRASLTLGSHDAFNLSVSTVQWADVIDVRTGGER